MHLSKEQFTQIIQDFNDGAFEDAALQEMMTEFYETEVMTGIQDPLIMERIFDYLDGKLQEEIRKNLKN